MNQNETKRSTMHDTSSPHVIESELLEQELVVPEGAKRLEPKDRKPAHEDKSKKKLLRKPTPHTLYQYFLLIAGSILFAFGVTMFISPWKFNTGGLIGISQIASMMILDNNNLAGLFNTLLNVPLFILAWRSLSKTFLAKTIISILVQSTLLSFLPVPTVPIFADPLTNVVFGAILGGLGIGLCLQSAGSAGGLDILGVYYSITKPGFSVGKISYIFNAFVELFAVYVYGLENALYSTLFILIMYFVSDRVHLQNISMAGVIITNNPEVKYVLLDKIHRGVTWWHGKGAYTGDDKEILLCIMNRYEVRYVKKLIHEHDPKAFFLLTKTKATLGNFERRLME